MSFEFDSTPLSHLKYADHFTYSNLFDFVLNISLNWLSFELMNARKIECLLSFLLSRIDHDHVNAQYLTISFAKKKYLNRFSVLVYFNSLN